MDPHLVDSSFQAVAENHVLLDGSLELGHELVVDGVLKIGHTLD